MIISFVQTKGGTGKSTLAMTTAFSRCMGRKFESIALVELDPQGTLNTWWSEREDAQRNSGKVSFHHISSTQKEVFQNSIKTIATLNQLIVMDIPGESTGKMHTRFACAYSDIVIIPMRTSTNDESAFAENLFPIIKDIVKVAPRLKRSFFVLPAFTHPQTRTKKLVDYFQDILPEPVGCLEAPYPFRSVYENFNRDGYTLLEYSKSVKKNKRHQQQAAKAVSDIENIAKHITLVLEK